MNYHAQIEIACAQLDGTKEKYEAFLELVNDWLAEEESYCA